MSNLPSTNKKTEDHAMPAVQRILVSFSFVIILFLVPHLHVYAVNITNLQFPLSKVITPIFEFSGLIFLGIWAVQKLLPNSLERKFQVFLIFASVIAWMQTNFFVGDFGFLDGREPDWQANKLYAYLQALLQIILLTFFIFRYKFVSRNAAFIAAMLSLSSVLSLFPHYSAIFEERENKYAFNTSQIFELSKEQNVIVILVDTLQADIVNEIFSESTYLKNTFTGFTFFRNAVSAFSKTYASVPALLSGTAFDNSTTLPIYLDETYRERSLPSRLLKEGFDVRLHSFAPYSLVAHPDVAMNVVGTKGDSPSQKGMLLKDIVLLSNLSLFKLVPHLIKPWIYNEGNFRIPLPPVTPIKARCVLTPENIKVSRNTHAFDARFFDEFSQCVNTAIDKPVFRYFHLSGAHAPFQFDNKFEYIGQQLINRKNFKAQSQGVLSKVSALLDKLKILNVYENSIIVILGDHGGGDLAVGLNLEQKGLPERREPEMKISSQKIMGGIPAILFKPAKAMNEFSLSDNPVSLTDIAHTISRQLDMFEYPFPGKDIYSLNHDMTRSRLHKYYVFSGWNMDYILPLIEYEINGFSWYPESWKPSTRNLNIIKDEDFQGLIMSFVRGGDLHLFSPIAWEEPKEAGTKMLGRSATIQVKKYFDHAMLLTMTHKGIPASAENTEIITVSLGSVVLDQWVFRRGDGQRKKAFVLPLSQVKRLREMPLIFTSDQKKSIIRFKELRFEPIEEYNIALDEPINFSNTGTGTKYQTFGWSTSEKWGSFSLGYRSGVLVRVTGAQEGDLELGIKLDAILFESWNEQSLSIVVNSHKIEEFIFRDDRSQEISLRIPADILNESRVLDIRFAYQNPIQPKWLGTSTDTRFLAIALKTIKVSGWTSSAASSKKPQQNLRYNLVSSEGVLLISDNNGKEYKIDKGSTQAYLDGSTNQSSLVHFSGWAINRENPKLRPLVVMFDGDDSISVNKIKINRKDVANHFQEAEFEKSGFSFSLPLERLRHAKSLRLFAISDSGFASELANSKNMEWAVAH